MDGLKLITEIKLLESVYVHDDMYTGTGSMNFYVHSIQLDQVAGC